MTADYTNNPTTPSAQQALAGKVLEPLLAKRRPGRILLLKHSNGLDLQLETGPGTQVIRLDSVPGGSQSPLLCRLDALPFERASFDLVVLHHLVNDGTEPLLDEALRVLVEGGDVVISGLNSSGLRNRIANRKRELAALKLDRVCQVLKSRSFTVEQCLMMGWGGFSRPSPKATWHGLGFPFADRVVLHGHHHSSIKGGRILRFRPAQAAGLSAAALDGCSSYEIAS
jgi:SAM-dependent methyltransferase